MSKGRKGKKKQDDNENDKSSATQDGDGIDGIKKVVEADQVTTKVTTASKSNAVDDVNLNPTLANMNRPIQEIVIDFPEAFDDSVCSEIDVRGNNQALEGQQSRTENEVETVTLLESRRKRPHEQTLNSDHGTDPTANLLPSLGYTQSTITTEKQAVGSTQDAAGTSKDGCLVKNEAIQKRDLKEDNAKAIKIEANIMTGDENLSNVEMNSNILSNPEDSLFTATVYIAVPLLKDHRLAIIGENDNFGRWKQPKGKFEPRFQIDKDIVILQGIVPVPTVPGSKFKFVQVSAEDTIVYEGEGYHDNRYDEILPGTTNFFIFKCRAKGLFGKFFEGLSNIFYKSESREEIGNVFFNITFNNVFNNIMPDWDVAIDFISESFNQIRSAVKGVTGDGFRKFLNRFLSAESGIHFDQLLLLLVGACNMGIYTKQMRDVITKNCREFSLYLNGFRGIKRNIDVIKYVLEQLALHAGSEYWWILFRLDRHTQHLEKLDRKQVYSAILKILQEVPELLLNEPSVALRVVDYLVRWNDIDQLYCDLQQVFNRNSNHLKLSDKLILERYLLYKTNTSDYGKILCSGFLKKVYDQSRIEDSNSSKDSEPLNDRIFNECIRTIFNQKLSDVVKLACQTPEYLLPPVIPVVEDTVLMRIKAISNFNRDEYRYFAQFKDEQLDHFPQTRQLIDEMLLKMTREHIKPGSFQSIPSLRLVLLGLSERTDIPLLERPKVVDLQKAINRLPRKFFQNLHAKILNTAVPVDKALKAYRNRETKDIVERLENHFDQLDEILAKIRSRQVPLIELSSLQDPHVLDCLKSYGLTDAQQTGVRQQVEELRNRYELYRIVYTRFARFTIPRDESVNDEQQEDENEAGNITNQDTVQVLEPDDWERYIKDINLDCSIHTLQTAIDLPLPLAQKRARWLFQLKNCALFIEKVWHPRIESVKTFPLCKEDLQVFVDECAERWDRLARRVAGGGVPFLEMNEIFRLKSDVDALCRIHLNGNLVEATKTACQNFKNIQELRHQIGPFVSVLRFFSIKERAPIDNLFNFVENNLLKQWDKTTLAQVTEKGIIRVLYKDLNIDPERPQTRDAMFFMSSLVTEENQSPLIEWLREKTEQDMEAMGKILQGTLLEAYGQLQTLRTRIAPFLNKNFNNYRDLLQVVRESEERFAQRVSGRVQPIKCKWLANMLPEIQAAIRASVISPSEDAKEKLAKLRLVVIDPKSDTYSMEVHLEPTGSFSMDELKQAFQLLDMAVMDDEKDGGSGDLLNRTRKHVSLIERLSEVFGLLYASGCITYTFREQVVIELDNLEIEIERMREELETWNKQWKEIEEMRLLALFSRGYLLRLADLIGRNRIDEALSILEFLLPSVPLDLERLLNRVAKEAPRISDDENSWLSTVQLFKVLRQLHDVIKTVFHKYGPEVSLPPFLVTYGRTLKSHFLDKAIVILNVSRELLVGSALAAYISVTRRPIEPSRILFVTANTDKQEMERFMTVWSVAKSSDIFIIVHVERLSAACGTVLREGVDRVLPECRAKLLLLAQHNHRTQSTKSLGARLGLVSDRLLETNFTADQLRHCFSTLLPSAANLHFFTSKLPGCGKSQEAMQQASDQIPCPDYYRIPVRIGSVEELITSLKSVENLSSQSKKRAAFLHLDVAHSVSLEFNDILLSLLIHGALYDPKNAKIGYWKISQETSIAIEFASPFGLEEFPIIGYLGNHHLCDCNQESFTYDLISMPNSPGQPVVVNRSNSLVAAGKFLQLKEARVQGLRQWDDLCSLPETLMLDPLPEAVTFELLLRAFQHDENRKAPSFSALNAMASFLHRHICAMINSMWFNCSAVYLFEQEELARLFKLNIFEMLLKVANDSVSRCWSIINKGRKIPEMDWTNRQRAMFLLGLNEDGFVTGMNVVGRDAAALKAMFSPSLLPILQQQCLQFQELRGFKSLMQTPVGAEMILNAMRSLLLLDGTATSAYKVFQMDNHPRDFPAIKRLQELTGQERGYVLTGDNITKMMFALYRIRCGLPVVAFGEAGVGKSALFRFLIETLLGHTFEVCNVNSGTSIHDVEKMIESAIAVIVNNPDAQVFLFFDEMNTADSSVIAFFKELMLDRNCHGTVLPDNLYLMGAANPYRFLHEADKEATVGLAFRFAQSQHCVNDRHEIDERKLVYRVNELPLAFYDHIYDFGYLCSEAEETYIDEICLNGLSKSQFSIDIITHFSSIIKQSHKVARALSIDPDSAVSLRDTTRAVQLLNWFCLSAAGKMLIRTDGQVAIDLTIYLVYAFRFRSRKTFLKNVFGPKQSASENMTNVSRRISQMLYKEAHGASIGSGAIALNDALCENLFALYVCVLNGIFLIIVGRPGSSKSLSVEILKLVLSPGNHSLRNKLGDLPSIAELYFQCSPLSTSSGFKALFESAQRLSVDPKTMLAMVVLDELGLADMSPEKPIKVLHSELERKSTLTSGVEQQSSFSVVALSNWAVDAAQLNRGILITRTQADKKDLIGSAKQLADSLVTKHVKESERFRINKMLADSLEIIVNTYQALDGRPEIGGGHFFSMRDFFFCVKNFVCSVFDSVEVGRMKSLRDIHLSQHYLIQSAIRNFGGHERAQNLVRTIMAENLGVAEITIPTTSPLDLIVQNVQDSAKRLSIHIARHLMILNRSMIGLQLLNRHVKSQLDDGTNWNVLFGSCFPGDLQVTAVTRKLRQVEQAIRSGGVLILCHADQLFESLYMVLNQQYWAQGDVTMTQIALGPSIRAIALPNGPFRIIALQDTDVALNQELMSPAILSRFEKHELRTSHLLDDTGRHWLQQIESHPVWLAVSEAVRRQKLIHGFHEESFASLALQLQDRGIPMELDEIEEIDVNGAHAIWLRAANPMAIIKLERDSKNHPELLDFCRRYRRSFVLEGLEDALNKVKSDRMVVMTNTLRHLEIKPSTLSKNRYSVIQLFDIQTELELYRLLDSYDAVELDDPAFCLIIQYDAVTGPIEQFQLAKYEVEQRFDKKDCRVAFIVHVDPRPVNMHWVFSFGDGWDYCFVDEVVPGGPLDQHHIPLSELVLSPADQNVSAFIGKMSVDSFKLLMLEILGPVLQTHLTSLRFSLGQFFSGVRTALGMPENEKLIQLLQECLLAQLNESRITWNVVDAVSDVHFDSSSSLTEGLWGVFKHKISNPFAHLLLVSDVWRVCDESTMKLWCDFITANYSDRLTTFHSSDTIVQMPVGFRSCTQPFGRLLASFDINFAQRPDSRLNGPLQWLLNYVNKAEGDFMKEAYFLDWLLLHTPPHLHCCVTDIPLSKMSNLVDSLFEESSMFFLDWEHWETEVISALELVSIASFAKTKVVDNGDNLWNNITSRVRNWKVFTFSAARLSLTVLSSPEVLASHEKFMQSVSSIEVSPALTELVERVEDLSQLWLGLRITKRILLFDPKSAIQMPELQVSTPQRLFESLTELVVNSVVRPRVSSGARARRTIRQADLYALLKSTSACCTPKELKQVLGECPVTNSIVLLEDNVAALCSSCHHPLNTTNDQETVVGEEEVAVDQAHSIQHLRTPKDGMIESLFQEHQKFMFFFERVAELFIQQRKNNPDDITEFLQHLLSPDSRLRVSWRFLTVILRSILSTRHGTDIIDRLLLDIHCNKLTRQDTNAFNLMRALLVSADQDTRNGLNDAEPVVTDDDLAQASMFGIWTVKRIRRLALFRHQLTLNVPNATANVIKDWSNLSRNQTDPAVTEPLLFFLLRFSSQEGDQTRLSALFKDRRIADRLAQHPVIGPYIHSLSPLSLGFKLQSANRRAIPFEDLLLNGTPINQDVYQHYPIVLELQPDWAPFITRLAFHAADVFEANNIRLLSRMTVNLVDTAQYLLPGIDNHPYLASFTQEGFRWFLCNCGALNCVGNCGHPTPESICVQCRVALTQRYPNPRAGVRRATPQDFSPPTGIHINRTPSPVPTFAVRNSSPVVTRFSLFLNSLALLNAALSPHTDQHAITHLLLSLPLAERRQNESRRSLIELLSNQVIGHLNLLCQLLVTTRPQLALTDQFRIGHLLLHKLLQSKDRSLMANAAEFAAGPQAREAFENGLAGLLAQQLNLATELDNLVAQCDEATTKFRCSLLNNEASHWTYTRLVFADRQSVQLELARNGGLRQKFQFLSMVLDDENWMRKLDALQYLGEAIRFIALVRTVLQGQVTQEEANLMTIEQGLNKITDCVSKKAVILDRGRVVSSAEHVTRLFDGFKQLWDRFSQLPNNETKTFLDYFECQQVDINIRPKTVLESTAPLILILASSEIPEATFSCQLLHHAVDAASSIALTDFIQPHCRTGSDRVRLVCSSAAALADFDESLYAHVSREEVDRFIRDHVIDGATLQLAESFAMAAVLGSAGSTIAEDLSLDIIPGFIFKDDVDSNNYLVVLERRSTAWQPSSIPPQIQELILTDLEKNRSLSEAKSILISAITHLQSNTEPLVLSKVRTHYISDVLQDLVRDEILTERHMSIATLSTFNRHLRIEVRHVFGLLKAIMSRMQGDDIFGGRVPKDWGTMMTERLAQLTNQKLRSDASSVGITETLLQLVSIVAASPSVPNDLLPDKSLLYAIRQIEGDDWNGIPSQLKMQHLGHVLLIAESLAKS